MQYGYFDDANKEYVVTNPKTPIKWINYIGSLEFGGFVDHTGGLLLCKGDPALNRIVKYLPQLPASEFKGHTLYLRTPEGKGFKVFSPFFVPTLEMPEAFSCRVGLGYTRFVSEIRGFKVEVTLFVPPGEYVMVEDVRVTNISSAPIELDLIPVVEYTHPDALKQFTNADWVPQTMQSHLEVDAKGNKLLTQAPFMHATTQVNVLASSWPVDSFESDRRHFLGDNEYGTWASPLSLQAPELGNHQALRGDNIGALLLKLGSIEPGETRRLTVMLAQAKSATEAAPLLERYRNFGNVDQGLLRMATLWEEYLSHQQVKTPDANLNSMINVHNPRQCYITKNWSRDLSLYQLGFGGRGIGFRDSSQDVMGVLQNIPEEGRELMEKLLQVQRRDGSAMHQFYASTMEASAGDAREREDRPQYYGDDHLWAVLAVCAYLAETGNMAFLRKELPYYEKGAKGVPLEQGSVMDHLRRALSFTHENTGRHGLPLLGFADWNDTVNLATGAESLFVANLYGKALLEMTDLCDYLGEKEQANQYRSWYVEMKDSVNRHAWDGEWYVRYFDWDGAAIGSKTNREGQVWANGQSWPVISGFATPERAQSALETVKQRLNTPNGIKLSAPGYNAYDPAKGGVTTYPPGAKENGGIFLHANPWVIIAETLVGNGDRAFEYYNQINPAAKNDSIDKFECEPYVYPQNILGDEHPQFGLARNSWLSGTASWCYQAATKYILGVLPTYAGLRINPCIPKAWKTFTVTRQFRGAEYQIQVSNPDGVSKGVKRVSVDGKIVEGNLIPVFEGGVHKVEVVLG